MKPPRKRPVSFTLTQTQGGSSLGNIQCLNEDHGDAFAIYHGDCVEILRQMPEKSIDLSVFSPPFGSLFTYSNSIADMGNSSCNGEFFDHYAFVVEQLMRVTKPGRLVAVHCSDLPTRKWVDGEIGLSPFSDMLSKAHIDAGFVLHSRITVWRDPVVEMQRTKALGLLYKQLKKDSAMSRVGMADYVLLFRKPGENAEPVGHKPADFPVDLWQKWASPVWMDIDQTDVLNVRMARDARDERHLCPLQLDLIERAITLWSNPGDIVLSPFAGIGSEGVGAIKIKRKFVGIEIKESYFRQAAKYLAEQEAESSTPTLLDMMA